VTPLKVDLTKHEDIGRISELAGERTRVLD
jgi:hypothetical protein